MRIKSGKQAGKLTETVLLGSGDFADYLMKTYPDNVVSGELAQLVGKLDAKPFVEVCAHCAAPATRVTAYANTSDYLMPWCASCDPYWSGARAGTLTVIRTFRDAMQHVEWTCSSAIRTEKRAIVRNLAQAKGLPQRLTEAAAVKFFT